MKERIRLRNKKTGQIVDLMGTERSCPYITIGIDFHDGDPKTFSYTSLNQLNEEWEDVKEPLIEDEKSRKVFKGWADLFGAERFRMSQTDDSRIKTTVVQSTDLTIRPAIELPGHIGEDSEIYTRSELIGEEEE